ncbi:MAG: pyrroline-5-carboxylate reductase family protein, partial [Planctomycetota bacterium]
MTVKSIGFIGGGRATQILIGGWAKSEKLPCEIVVSDPDESVLARLKENHSEVQIVANGNERAVSQDIVFLAVHPPAIADAMANVKTGIKPDAVLVSLAPKLTISRLSEMLDGFGRGQADTLKWMRSRGRIRGWTTSHQSTGYYIGTHAPRST